MSFNIPPVAHIPDPSYEYLDLGTLKALYQDRAFPSFVARPVSRPLYRRIWSCMQLNIPLPPVVFAVHTDALNRTYYECLGGAKLLRAYIEFVKAYVHRGNRSLASFNVPVMYYPSLTSRQRDLFYDLHLDLVY